MSQYSAIIGFLEDLDQEIEGKIDQISLLNSINMSEGYDDILVGEERSVSLSTTSDNEVKASSVKLYNYLKISQTDFRLSILELAAPISGLVGTVLSGNAIPTIIGLFGLIASFLKKSKKEYSKLDARVLFCIYQLGKSCHVDTIAAEYQRLFQETLPADHLNNSLNLLASFRTIRRVGEEIIIIESIKIYRT